jgi:hypothetical protein
MQLTPAGTDFPQGFPALPHSKADGAVWTRALAVLLLTAAHMLQQSTSKRTEKPECIFGI